MTTQGLGTFPICEYRGVTEIAKEFCSGGKNKAVVSSSVWRN